MNNSRCGAKRYTCLRVGHSGLRLSSASHGAGDEPVITMATAVRTGPPTGRSDSNFISLLFEVCDTGGPARSVRHPFLPRQVAKAHQTEHN